MGGLARFLLIIVLGVREFGVAFLELAEAHKAAFEPTKWGKVHGYDASTVAQSATNLPAITVSPSRPCGCATGTGKCNSACSDGIWSQPYIVVTTSMCYKAVFNWRPGVSYCSSGNSQCSAADCTSSQFLLSSQSQPPRFRTQQCARW
jgi:hypothetical protein